MATTRPGEPARGGSTSRTDPEESALSSLCLSRTYTAQPMSARETERRGRSSESAYRGTAPQWAEIAKTRDKFRFSHFFFRTSGHEESKDEGSNHQVPNPECQLSSQKRSRNILKLRYERWAKVVRSRGYFEINKKNISTHCQLILVSHITFIDLKLQ